MDELNLYKSPDVVMRIKKIAKMKNISIKEMLSDIGLGINTLSHMNHGKAIAFDSLARIADYLGCPVDYLLGRDTESDQKKEPAIENDDRLDAELIKMLCQLRSDEAGRVRDFVSGLIAARKG